MRLSRLLLWSLLAVVGLRLVGLGLYPLMDTTEARYGDISRIMVELNDWITPWFNYDVPFWGKPPLGFWLSALGAKFIGVTEFGLRFPQWLAAMMVLAVVWGMAARRSRAEALLSVSVLAGAWVFFVSAGLIMTDIGLVLGVAMAMYAFWVLVHQPRSGLLNPYALMLFVGLAIAVLSKGPIGLIFSLGPIGLWAIWQRKIAQTWHSVPWISGGLLFALLVIPWFIAAELKTPGFLEYFIIGEHFNRFLVPGWEGDMYGSPHDTPRGTIWVFYAIGFLPWTLVIPALLLLNWRRGVRAHWQSEDASRNRYLWLFALLPAIFFTLSSHVLTTYVLPSLPAAALLLGAWLKGLDAHRRVYRWVAIGMLTTAAFFATVLAVESTYGDLDARSMKFMQASYEADASPDSRLVYFQQQPFSARFYSAGRAKLIESQAELLALPRDGSVYLAYPKHLSLPADLRDSVRLVNEHSRFMLYQITESSAEHLP